MDLKSLVDGLGNLFQLIANSSAGATLSVVGFILLLCGVAISRLALKSSPRSTPTWVKLGLFGCLIGGVLFSSLGPTIALLQLSSYAILKVSTDKAFDNLGTNERVYWLIRLIPYDPHNNPELAIGRLKQLGPPNQAYTFVAAYDELVGYGVDDAIRMIGGTYNTEQRVSAIIFPRAPWDIYPANARGLLQIIQQIENGPTNKIDKRLLKDTDTLKDEEVADLKHIDALSYWRFENYKKYFKDYCELAERFRCDNSYSARNYMGGLNIDWHPLGFAQKEVEEDSCSKDAGSYCSISNWAAAKASLKNHFGSRVFLLQNLTIDNIPNRILIDFGNPPNQFIPDIGFRTQRR
jgi:hypothetical protein